MKLSVIVAAAFAAAMFAQTPPEHGQRMARQPGQAQAPAVSAAKAFLGLDDAQVQKLEALQQQKMTAVRDLMKASGEKQKQLGEKLESGSADADAVGQLTLDIRNTHKKIEQIESDYRAQAAKLLNAEQAEKLKKLEEVSEFERKMAEASMLGPIAGEAASLSLVSPAPPPPTGRNREGMMQHRHMGRGMGPQMGPGMHRHMEQGHGGPMGREMGPQMGPGMHRHMEQGGDGPMGPGMHRHMEQGPGGPMGPGMGPQMGPGGPSMGPGMPQRMGPGGPPSGGPGGERE